MSDPEFDADVLIQHYVEGRLTNAEAAHLHGLLEADPALAERLLDHVSMDAMVRSTKELRALPQSRPALLPRRRFTFVTLYGVAAMAACVALVGAWAWHSLVGESASNNEDTTAAVAVLSRGVNLQWEPGSATPATGSPLSPGWLHLKSGLAQIEFYKGARVLIEGPAAFQLISSGEACCTSGKLSAHVPPQARGFKINTPKGTIVDLGTEFGLDLNEAAAQVHVFKGEVELHQVSSPMQSLKEGQAVALAESSKMLNANAAAFASLNDLEERTAVSQRTQFQRWQAASTAWNNDPGLRLRFDFQDNVESRSLQNLARLGSGVPDGSIVGGAWTDGRWAGKRALEFRNVSDRVRLSVPGDVDALTLTAWVRVNGLDRAYNSLFMCEGWANGKVHWQITREGKVRLGVASRDGKPHNDYDTPALFTPERFGQWTHLAVVFDPVAKEVRHYANGELVARLPVKTVFPLHLSMAELGNWNDGHADRVAIRHLSGAMDEFALYSRALGNGEIGAMFEAGRPDSQK